MNAATSVPVSVAAVAPSVVKVSIQEDRGAIAGSCTAVYSLNGATVNIPVNGGRPF